MVSYLSGMAQERRMNRQRGDAQFSAHDEKGNGRGEGGTKSRGQRRRREEKEAMRL